MNSRCIKICLISLYSSHTTTVCNLLQLLPTCFDVIPNSVHNFLFCRSNGDVWYGHFNKGNLSDPDMVWIGNDQPPSYQPPSCEWSATNIEPNGCCGENTTCFRMVPGCSNLNYAVGDDACSAAQAYICQLGRWNYY